MGLAQPDRKKVLGLLTLSYKFLEGGNGMQALGLFCLFIGVVVSVRARHYFSMWRTAEKTSMLSSAIAQLVGTAGGIYLSLELLFSFLKIPENWWKPSTFMVEPLAVISLVLAIVQPFAIRAWIKIRN